eukprot:jgi/Tetstr1/466619/TSEL_011107.t1
MGFGQSLPSARGRLLPVAAPSPDLLLSTAVAILAERRQYSGGGIRCAEKRLIALPAKQPRPARPFVGERATAAAQQCRLAQPRLSKFAAAVLAADDIALWQHDASACVEAAARGRLEVLKWVYKPVYPADMNACWWAVNRERLEVLQ